MTQYKCFFACFELSISIDQTITSVLLELFVVFVLNRRFLNHLINTLYKAILNLVKISDNNVDIVSVQSFIESSSLLRVGSLSKV
jgi:hypothetical protein